MGTWLGDPVYLVADGRFSDVTLGLMVGHIAPDDAIVLDVKSRRLDVELSDQQLRKRLGQWREPEPH
jgi:dihydroxy-acid dehydratase